MDYARGHCVCVCGVGGGGVCVCVGWRWPAKTGINTCYGDFN